MFIQKFVELAYDMQFLLSEAEPVAIVKEPGRIVGPIAGVLGKLCDFLFNTVSANFSSATLGITIIFFTIIVRIILLPFAAYSAKSMAKMKMVQPEIKKIQEKYKGKKDQESQRKMSMEITAFQKKEGVNPANGCLPLLIQMPVIYALFSILNRTYFYINEIGQLYDRLSKIIMSVPKIGSIMYDNVIPGMPTLKKFVESRFNLAYADNCREVLSKMAETDWAALLSRLPTDVVTQLNPLLEQKTNIEYFWGINLVERPSFLALSVLIPLLSGITTFLSTWLMNRAQGMPTDEAQKTQQRYMLITMPILMGFMTFTLPAGIGLYWTCGNVFQMGQQYVFNRIYDPKKPAKGEEKGSVKG